MLENIHSFEILNLILLVGVITSTILRRKTGINPGGIITAPLLVLSFYFSFIWGMTIVVLSYLIYKIYDKYLSHIYFGRNPMYITSILSILFVYGMAWTYGHLKIIPDMDINFIYGLILPAIIASALRKQGVKNTYLYTFISVVINVVVFLMVYFIAKNVFNDNFFYIEQLRRGTETLNLHYGILLILISIIVSFITYRITKIKPGGYIVLPFIAVMLFNLKSLAIFIIMLIFVHFLIKLIRRHTLLFGITRFSLVLCVSIVLVWSIELISLKTDTKFSPFMGANIFPALALASITNDFSVQKARHTLPVLLINLAVVGIVYYFIRGF